MSSDLETVPLSIAVIGGGVGGLSFASTLMQDPSASKRFKVTIYEAQADLGEFGAGISISGRTFAIAKGMGMENALAEIDQNRSANGATGSDLVVCYRRSDSDPGHEVFRESFGRGAAYHRAEFRTAFARHIQSLNANVEIQFKKRLVEVQRADTDAQSELRFSDGTHVIADVVIGCDGVRSPTRAAMLDTAARDLDQPSLRKLAPAVYSGSRVYRAVVPVQIFDDLWRDEFGASEPHRVHRENLLMYTGKRNHIANYLIAGRTLVNIGIMDGEYEREGELLEGDWVKNDVDTSRLFERFADWEPEVQALAKAMPKASLWTINVTQKLPFHAYQNIALLGDAAHAMTPNLANGANQTLEDAYVLGRVLSDPLVSRATIPQALQAYDAIRRPHAQKVVESSRTCGFLLDWALEYDQDAELAEQYRKAGGWIKEGDIEDDVANAVKRFRQSVLQE